MGKARNSGASHANIYPEDLLIHSHPISVLDYCLAAFVLEARRQDGNYYPGNTIRNILAALFRFLKENAGVKSAPNFIDRGQREANFPRLPGFNLATKIWGGSMINEWAY